MFRIPYSKFYNYIWQQHSTHCEMKCHIVCSYNRNVRNKYNVVAKEKRAYQHFRLCSSFKLCESDAGSCCAFSKGTFEINVNADAQTTVVGCSAMPGFWGGGVSVLFLMNFTHVDVLVIICETKVVTSLNHFSLSPDNHLC